jgi:hypothetical protein
MDLEGNGHVIIDILSQNLSGETEENHKNVSVTKVDVLEIRTENLPNTSQECYENKVSFIAYVDYVLLKSRYSDWLRAERQKVSELESRYGQVFPFSTSSRPVLGRTRPPIQWLPVALSPGVKRPGREADHSPPTVAKDKKTWTYSSTPPYVFTA